MAPSLTGHIASEDGIIEQPALVLLGELGWSRLNLAYEVVGPVNPTGRTSRRQPYLPARLRAALARLNPGLPPLALTLAEAELTRDRSAMLPVTANREVHRLLREGVPIEVKVEDGRTVTLRVRIIDWRDALANDFLAAS